MKLAFIGGGNMGTAILSAVIERGLARPVDITVSDVVEDRLKLLRDGYGIVTTRDNREAVKTKDVIVLSIKPQTLREVMEGLKSCIGADQLVLSIIAGARIGTIRDGLGHSSIVRVMPNTPAQVFEGMSVWTATSGVTDQQKKLAGAVLGAIGKEIYVDDEKYLDMVTAVSGSGPAYFFLFAEALTEAGISIGLSPDISYQLVLQTLIGSGKLMRETGTAPAELRKMVTSKGGTTASALAVFESGKFNDMVTKAVKAAYDRSRELGGEK